MIESALWEKISPVRLRNRGQITIPQAMRDSLNIVEGDALYTRERFQPNGAVDRHAASGLRASGSSAAPLGPSTVSGQPASCLIIRLCIQ